METAEMSTMVGLTGERRVSMSKAAKLLGVCYATVRRYVIERAEVPSERRGKPRNPERGQGCKVFIDEFGLEKLREILPPNYDSSDERS
jgi:hypothetical protein